MQSQTRKHQNTGKNFPENKLAVVVARANELRNVLKLDKQSPFVTLRLQDQEAATRVLPRAGQTPRWDEAHWFSLDGIDMTQERNRAINVNVYHQKKGDAKMICCAEIDFTPALTQSTEAGYDGWFDLYWEGRQAGRIFLEFTYYPKVGEVPIGTKSLARSGGRTSMMNNKIISREELPVLGEANTSKTDSDSYSDLDEIEGPNSKSFASPLGSPKKSIKPKSKAKQTDPPEGGLFHFLDRKLQNLAGKFTTNTESVSDYTTENEGWLTMGEDFGDVKRKVESPELIKTAPTNLFGDSVSIDDDEDDDDDFGANNYKSHNDITGKPYYTKHTNKNLNNFSSDARRSIAKRQEMMLGEALSTPIDDYDDDDENDSDDNLVMGQAVDFRSSTRSAGLRQSYAAKPLPSPWQHKHGEKSEVKDDDDDEESDDKEPPPPPKHIIPANSLFESGMRPNSEKHRKTSNATTTNMSWYERRMNSRRNN